MELKEGMYVRTKQGYIAKFKKYDEIFNILRFETPIFLRSWMPCDYMQKDRFMNRYFSKASNNIIDLIEENDYIRIITSSCFEPVYYSYGKLVIRDDIPIEDYSNDFIAEVITHEQMKSISYRIGG